MHPAIHSAFDGDEGLKAEAYLWCAKVDLRHLQYVGVAAAEIR
jgi:hypothetical protein